MKGQRGRVEFDRLLAEATLGRALRHGRGGNNNRAAALSAKSPTSRRNRRGDSSRARLSLSPLITDAPSAAGEKRRYRLAGGNTWPQTPVGQGGNRGVLDGASVNAHRRR